MEMQTDLESAWKFINEQQIVYKMRLMQAELGLEPDALIVSPLMAQHYFPEESLEGALVYGLRVSVDPDCPADTVIVCAQEREWR